MYEIKYLSSSGCHWPWWIFRDILFLSSEMFAQFCNSNNTLPSFLKNLLCQMLFCVTCCAWESHCECRDASCVGSVNDLFRLFGDTLSALPLQILLKILKKDVLFWWKDEVLNEGASVTRTLGSLQPTYTLWGSKTHFTKLLGIEAISCINISSMKIKYIFIDESKIRKRKTFL